MPTTTTTKTAMLSRSDYKVLKALIKVITTVCDKNSIEVPVVVLRLKSAPKQVTSLGGAIGVVLKSLASIYGTPIKFEDKPSTEEIVEKQLSILKTLKIADEDLDSEYLLTAINTSYGYHTFCTTDDKTSLSVLIEGKMPSATEFRECGEELLQNLGITHTFTDSFNEAKWLEDEAECIKKAKADVKAMNKQVREALKEQVSINF